MCQVRNHSKVAKGLGQEDSIVIRVIPQLFRQDEEDGVFNMQLYTKRAVLHQSSKFLLK